jgi:hypothetical protein
MKITRVLLVAIGVLATSIVAIAGSPPPANAQTVALYNPLVPSRILDTRTGLGAAASTVAGGATIDVSVAGIGGVPALGANSVAVNITVVSPTGGGFLTVFPTGEVRPDASNLNFVAGQTVPNLVIAKLGTGGKISIFVSANSHVIADVQGWFSNGGGYVPLSPARLLDTRAGVGAPVGAIASGASVDLQITGQGGVPLSGVDSVVVNLTAVAPTGGGYITVWPTGSAQPNTSNVNFSAGSTVPNLVVTRVGNNGKISIYNFGGRTEVLADIQGYFTTGAGMNSLVPSRVIDTRIGIGTSIGPVLSQGTLSVLIAGRGGVPATGIGAVVLNVTVTQPTQAGYITSWPYSEGRPTASNLNFSGGQTVANLVLAKVGPTGRVSLFNSSGNTHLIVDVVGWLPGVEGTDTGCVVTAPPAALNYNTFYQKYCSIGGFSIIASGVVSDFAMQRTWTMIRAMSRKRPDVLPRLAAANIRFGVIGKSQRVTEMPEWSDLYTAFPGTDWDNRARGFGATVARPLVGIGEENMICDVTDRYVGENVGVHEFAHTFLQFGIEPADARIRPALNAAFSAAISSGKWANTYAATNADEYWGEGAQDWFDTNAQAIPTNGIHNSINTRAELQTYDPPLYGLMDSVFPADPWTPGCP